NANRADQGSRRKLVDQLRIKRIGRKHVKPPGPSTAIAIKPQVRGATTAQSRKFLGADKPLPVVAPAIQPGDFRRSRKRLAAVPATAPGSEILTKGAYFGIAPGSGYACQS